MNKNNIPLFLLLFVGVGFITVGALGQYDVLNYEGIVDRGLRADTSIELQIAILDDINKRYVLTNISITMGTIYLSFGLGVLSTRLKK